MPILDKNNKEEVKKYKEFLNNSEFTKLTQSLEWGKIKNNWIQEVVYLENDGRIIAGMTILLEKVPKINSYLMYCSRGPVCDPKDLELIKKLVKEAEVLAKKYNAFCLKFDPQIEYSDSLNKLYLENGFKTSRKES